MLPLIFQRPKYYVILVGPTVWPSGFDHSTWSSPHRFHSSTFTIITSSILTHYHPPLRCYVRYGQVAPLFIFFLVLLVLLLFTFPNVGESGSSTGKAFVYGQGGPGSIPGVGGVEIFLHFFVSRLVLGSIQLPVKWVDYRGLSPGIKAAERRTSHPTSS